MENYFGKLNMQLPLKEMDLSQGIDLFYLDVENYYFHIVTLNLSSDNSALSHSRFAIFKCCNKTSNPAISICNLLGEIINSDYHIACSTKQIKVSVYQPEIREELEQRAKAVAMDEKTYNKKLNQFKIIRRNYFNKINRKQLLQHNKHIHQRKILNNKVTPPFVFHKLIDELYHGSFIVPIKCTDCTNIAKLPKFLHNFKTEKATTLLNVPIKDIRKGEITIYSDASIKSRNYAASCLIFVDGLNGILCSIKDHINTEDSTIPEFIAMQSAFTILNEMFDIKGKELTFLSDNQNLLHEIKNAENDKAKNRNQRICEMLNILKDCKLKFEKIDERNQVFSLVDRESKNFRNISN